MDVGGWLRGLGLGQYEAAFRENAIDDTVLPSLTAEDLKDLGVGIVGHRRKLLDAIADLCADAVARAPSSKISFRSGGVRSGAATVAACGLTIIRLAILTPVLPHLQMLP